LIVHTATAWKYDDLGRLLQVLKDIVALYLIPLITPRNLTKEQRLGQKMAEKESKSASVLEDAETIPSPSFPKLPESGTHERMLAERELLRKLDMRLLPTIFVIFIMNYIDVCTNFTSTVR